MLDHAWALEAAQKNSEYYSYGLTTGTEYYSVSSAVHDCKLRKVGVSSSARPSGKCYLCGFKDIFVQNTLLLTKNAEIVEKRPLLENVSIIAKS